MFACQQPNNSKHINHIQNKEKVAESVPLKRINGDTSDFENYLLSYDLVNISNLDTTVRVALHYSTNQNFLNKPMYDGLINCYLPCEVAIKLANAQFYLKSLYPNYNLIVFDAVRPLHIQEKMWNELDIPNAQKSKYLAHPNDFSLHNFGAAVDIGIIGTNDLLLDMGSAFDFFGELSEPKNESKLLEQGLLTTQHIKNRKLLREVMLRAGFNSITSEWWHFNSDTKIEAAKKYALIK